jgi:hypothetical protein
MGLVQTIERAEIPDNRDAAHISEDHLRLGLKWLLKNTHALALIVPLLATPTKLGEE